MAAVKPRIGNCEEEDWDHNDGGAVSEEGPSALKDKERAVLDQFRAVLQASGARYKGRFPDDRTLLRFLRARNFHLKDAKAMLEATLAWREENSVDHIRKEFQYPERTELKKFYPQFHHQTDKSGRPIYIEQFGRLDVDKVLEVTTMERLLKFHIQEWEILTDLKFPACSAKAGVHIEKSLTILDLKGVNPRSFAGKVRHFAKEVTRIDQDHYPEHLGTMLIINTPIMFKAVWQVVKLWLDKKTQTKIQVLGAHYQKRLLELVDADMLPHFLGGTCLCEGGCESSDVGPWQDPQYQVKEGHS